MSLLIWSDDSLPPTLLVALPVCPLGAATEPVEPVALLCGELMSLEDEDEVLGEALCEFAPVVELLLDCPATLPLEGDVALESVEALGVWLESAEGVLAVEEGCEGDSCALFDCDM